MIKRPARFIIYGLFDPRTSELRYVGKSVFGTKRARSHGYPKALSKDRTRCGSWIKSLKNQGLNFEYDTIEVFENPEDLAEAEMFWIAYFKSIGCNLTNHTLGGEGCLGRTVSPETRERVRLANLGNKNALGSRRSVKTRELLSEIAKNRAPPTEEVRMKISKKLQGHKQPLEQIEKRVRNSPKKHKPHTEEAKRKMSESAKKKPPMTEETKRKMSQSLKGRRLSQEQIDFLRSRPVPPISEETRKKMSDSSRKRRASEETRKKMSESAQKAWKNRRLKDSEKEVQS